MATYIKGSSVANATGYELFEKTGDSYNSLQTKNEINFEVSALGLTAGNHSLAVQAHADGYESSDYSNEVIYTVAAATFLDLDFTNKTVQDYIDDGIISAGNSSVANLTYDAGGLVCNDTDLIYGLKLASPINTAQNWTVEAVMTIAPFANSGTGTTEAVYKNLAILSNNDDHESHPNTCLAPVVMNNGWKAGLRLAEGASTAIDFGAYFTDDGIEHSYKFVYNRANNSIEFFVDGVSKGTRTWAEETVPVAGKFGYIFGIHKGYSYYNSYRPKAGYKLKSLKVYN